jgi:transmembrane sensor
MNEFYINNENMKEENFLKMDTREKILNYSAGFIPPSGESEDESLTKLMLLVKASPSKPTIYMRNWLWAAAAVPLIAILYAGFSYFAPTKVRTDFAEQKSVLLPDHTEVVLNADSKMTFSKKNFSQKRSIRISGEAFLKVQKGSDFSIYTPTGMIEILGTELNILSRDSFLKVTCVSGKVKVTSHHQTLIIEPGEKAELSSESLLKKTGQDTKKIISWKNGEFYFEESPLVYIFDEIERQFNVTIKFTGLDKRYFTGSFSNKNLREALDIVCIPMDLKYEINERNNIIITSKTD